MPFLLHNFQKVVMHLEVINSRNLNYKLVSFR